MRSYSHSDADVVGVCKSGGNGVCNACIASTEYGVSCSESCTRCLKEERALHESFTKRLSGVWRGMKAVVFIAFGAIAFRL